MGDFVTVGVVGAVLGETIILLKDTITTIEMFPSRLRNILAGLDYMKPQFDKMRAYKDLNDRPNKELRLFYDFLIACQFLVVKCKNTSRWQLYEKNQCSKQLQDLENQIAEFCAVNLLAMFGSDMKDANPIISVESAPNYEQVKGEYEYDVFLSFRGDDTRESFTSTLFYTLSKVHKVKTFMDVIFKKGSKLEELLKMVEKSRMSIVVFSENFAESEWCLKELTKIFEESDRREHEILPVFYKISPSELRHQHSGKTIVHMEMHQNKYGKDSDIVKSWSNAIKELGNSSGYTYWSGRGKQEIELAEEIAQEILSRLHG